MRAVSHGKLGARGVEDGKVLRGLFSLQGLLGIEGLFRVRKSNINGVGADRYIAEASGCKLNPERTMLPPTISTDRNSHNGGVNLNMPMAVTPSTVGFQSIVLVMVTSIAHRYDNA